MLRVENWRILLLLRCALTPCSSGDFESHIYLDKLTEARVEKDLDSYSIKLLGVEGKPLLTMLLNGSVPDAAAIKAWKELRSTHGDAVFFDDNSGEAMFSFSDA